MSFHAKLRYCNVVLDITFLYLLKIVVVVATPFSTCLSFVITPICYVRLLRLEMGVLDVLVFLIVLVFLPDGVKGLVRKVVWRNDPLLNIRNGISKVHAV